MVQHMSEDDSNGRMEFCQWPSRKSNEEANFSSKILFTEDVNFYVNDEANRQSLLYWSDANPHWMSPTNMQKAGNVIVWSRI